MRNLFPGFTGLFTGAVILLGVGTASYFTKKFESYNLDPKGKPGAFEPFLGKYIRMSEFIIGLRNSLLLYNNEFTAALGLKEHVEAQRCTLAVKIFGAREFIFILIDPSTYSETDLTIDKHWRNHLASGRVSKELTEDVRTKLTLLRDHRALGTDIKLEATFSSAIKILLVHYPVDETKFTSGLEGLVLPHGCEGIGELVNMLKSEFHLDMVFHGHLHVPMLYNYNGVQVVSVSTSTRVDDGHETGFYLIKVFDSGNVVAEHHLWNGINYTPDPNRALSKDLGYFPPSKALPAA
jgi:hypothetical protein